MDALSSASPPRIFWKSRKRSGKIQIKIIYTFLCISVHGSTFTIHSLCSTEHKFRFDSLKLRKKKREISHEKEFVIFFSISLVGEGQSIFRRSEIQTVWSMMLTAFSLMATKSVTN
jgi:hypothetical protein